MTFQNSFKTKSQSKLLGHFCVFPSPQCWCTRWLNRNEQHWEGKGKHGKGKKGVCVVSQLFLPETVLKSCVSLTSKYTFVLNFHHENNCSSYQQQIILYYTSGIILLIIVNAVYVLTNPDICCICNTAYVKKTCNIYYIFLPIFCIRKYVVDWWIPLCLHTGP